MHEDHTVALHPDLPFFSEFIPKSGVESPDPQDILKDIKVHQLLFKPSVALVPYLPYHIVNCCEEC
jgi:hypothetical protein